MYRERDKYGMKNLEQERDGENCMETKENESVTKRKGKNKKWEREEKLWKIKRMET